MIEFFKYQGTGNDFILIDNRDETVILSKDQVALLCHRRFGIGADGLMLLGLKDGYDFHMTYYNSDGAESSMCGNGGRCITAFAKRLGLIDHSASFIAIDGAHKATIAEEEVELEMIDVLEVDKDKDDFVMDTGSPHYVRLVDTEPAKMDDFVSRARSLRQASPYKVDGINVNFIHKHGAFELSMRTFERGVEDETYSCGTGAVAAAVAFHQYYVKSGGYHQIGITTPGGSLNVSFRYSDKYEEILLKGPARFVFKGQIDLS